MEVFTGKKTRMSFVKEATYGTNPGTIDGWLGIINKVDDGGVSRDMLELRGLDASTLNDDDFYNTVQKYGGSIELYMQVCSPLAWAWGKDVKTGAGPSYTHTIQEADTLSSMTTEVANQMFTASASHIEKYTGTMFAKEKVSWSQGNPIMVNIDWVAQNRTHADGTPTTYEATVLASKKYNASGTGSIAPFMSHMVDINLAGNDLPYVISGSISIDNNLTADVVCDNDTGNKIAEPFATHRTFDVEVVGYISTDAYYDALLAEFDGTPLGSTSTVTFTRSATDKVVFTLGSNSYLEKLSKPHDVGGDRVEFTAKIRTNNVSPVVTDAVDVNYITEA